LSALSASLLGSALSAVVAVAPGEAAVTPVEPLTEVVVRPFPEQQECGTMVRFHVGDGVRVWQCGEMEVRAASTTEGFGPPMGPPGGPPPGPPTVPPASPPIEDQPDDQPGRPGDQPGGPGGQPGGPDDDEPTFEGPGPRGREGTPRDAPLTGETGGERKGTGPRGGVAGWASDNSYLARVLPRTASSVPGIALVGLWCLGLGLLLRYAGRLEEESHLSPQDSPEQSSPDEGTSEPDSPDQD
jgi:hypothetical protein